MFLLSITGLFRMVLTILAVLFLVRYFSRILNARNNAAQERKIRDENLAFKKAKEKSELDKGKVEIVDSNQHQAEDVDFEELD